MEHVQVQCTSYSYSSNCYPAEAPAGSSAALPLDTADGDDMYMQLKALLHQMEVDDESSASDSEE
jgi:hypothetical protein